MDTLTRRRALQSALGLTFLSNSELSCGPADQEQTLTALLPPRPKQDDPFKPRPFTWNDYLRNCNLQLAPKPAFGKSLHLRLVRPEDGIDFSFEFHRLKHNAVSPRGRFALLIAELPGQALIQPPIGSSTPQEGDDCSTAAQYPLHPGTRLSEPSTIAMLVDLDQDADLDLETVLAWFRHPWCAGTQLVEPAGLNLLPEKAAVFYASPNVRRDGSIRRLWTARLVHPVAPAPGTSAEGAPSLFPVTTDRRPLVTVSSANNLAYGGEMAFPPGTLADIIQATKSALVPAKHLLVSSQGAWLDVGTTFPPSIQDHSLTSFHERLAQGIEQEAQATFLARLCPTGHLVTVVVSSKLQWCRKDAQSPLVAEFVQRAKLVYNKPTLITYDNFLASERRIGFHAPVNAIRLIGKETPYLALQPALDFISSCGGTDPYKPYWADYLDASGNPVHYDFPVEITDRAGQTHQTTMQMLVACYSRENDPNFRQDVTSSYSSQSPQVDLKRERVAYAVPNAAGNTSYPTQTIFFAANPFPAGAGKLDQSPWYPVMASASINLEQVTAFSPSLAPVPVSCKYAQAYIDDPFDVPRQPNQVKNRAEVILSLTESQPFTFNAALGGGLAQPNSKLIGLGRRVGSVFSLLSDKQKDIEATLQTISTDGMKVADIFGDASLGASLLGAVQLSDILAQVSDGIAQMAKLPQLAVQQITALEDNVLDTVRQQLQTLLNIRNDAAFQTVIALADQINQIYAQLQNQIQYAACLLSVLCTEGTPGDLDFLVDNGSQPISGQAANLRQLAMLPILDRIKKASGTFPDSVLPTLYVVRDYVVYPMLAAAGESTVIATLDDALESNQSTLQTIADLIQSEAGDAIATLTDTPLLKLCLSLDALYTALYPSSQAQPDLATVISAFQNTLDAANALPPDPVSQFNNFSQNVLADVTNQVSLLSSSLEDSIAWFDSNAQNVDRNFYKIIRQTLQQAIPSTNPVSGLIGQIAGKIAPAPPFLQQLISLLGTASGAIQNLAALASVKVGYTYQTALQDFGPFEATYDGSDQATFELVSSVEMDLAQPAQQPKFSVHAAVKNFQLNLVPDFEFVSIGFNQVTFDWNGSGAPIVNTELNPGDIELLGPLDFVSQLASAINLPSGLDVQPTGNGVVIGYDAIIPAIEAGAFNIVNLGLYTAVQLNFDGSPMRAIFGFASPNQHFTITYFFLGGGGFLDMEFTPESSVGNMTVSGALEVGAMVALNFGIAGGDAYAFVGVYFSLSATDVTLSGYFRAGGEIEVLGLISVSIEFLMSLTYEDRNGQAWLSGDCEVEVDVHVLFFSESVSLHLHHDFSGTSMD